MNTSGVVRAAQRDVDKLSVSYRRIAESLEEDRCPFCPELAGDLLLLLAGGRPRIGNDEALSSYGSMLRALTRNVRWRLVNRLVLRVRHASERPKAPPEQLEAVLEFLVRTFCYRLAHFEAKDVFSSDADAVSRLNAIAEVFLDDRDRFTERVLDSYVLAMLDFVLRVRSVRFADQWVNRELVKACLGEEWTDEEYVPARRRFVRTDGEEEERLPGDLSAVRGITVKTREDQIVDIVPSEWSEWFDPRESVHKAGVYRILSKPLIYQHFQTRRPEVRQRVLFGIVIGAEPRVSLPASQRADLMARTMAFRALVEAASRIDHDQIEVEVAWIEAREGAWENVHFPLHDLRVTDNAEDNWRNVTETARVLPHFFVRWRQGERHDSRRLIPRNDAPAVVIQGILARRAMDAVVLLTLMRDKEKHLCLLPPSLALPGHNDGLRRLIVCCANDGETSLRAQAFHDLVGANVAAMPLPPAEGDTVMEMVLTALIGPLRDTTRAPTSRLDGRGITKIGR